MAEWNFGNYLATVQERDIDLLLMEEFHVSPVFVTWFSTQVGLNDVAFAGAWHSVSDIDGETDLLLLLAHSGKRLAVLIENKVGAAEQPDQDARYHLRAVRYIEDGKFDEYRTCICAPEIYLAALPDTSRYECRVSYEKILKWYSSHADSRSAWRSHIMSEAIEQGRRGYTMIVDQTTTKFHREYWTWVNSKHPRLTMQKPTQKGKKSNWIILRSPDMPKGVSISHKNNQACVELTFDRTLLSELLAIKNDWPPDIIPRQKGGTTVLEIRVPELDMSRDVAEQSDEMECALSAAERLLQYCDILQPTNPSKIF